MESEKRSGNSTGALAGAILSLAMIAVFFAGWRVADLPFVPFDIFDWMARVLPGRIISFGINSMVSTIRTFGLGPTATVAKSLEQLMGIAVLFFTGIACGALLFVTIRALRGRYVYLLGLSTGGLAGVSAVLIRFSLPHVSEVSLVTDAVWVILVFLVWGTALAWSCGRLQAAGDAIAHERSDSLPQAFVERINRRTFLIRLGGVSATIAVSGAVVGALVGRGESRHPPPARPTRWSDTHDLPNAHAAVKPAPGTRPEYTPLEKHYRIDIDTIPITIDGSSWRLKIAGLVEKPLDLTLDELRRHDPLHQFITLACISNTVGGDLIGTTRWTGVSLQRLLPDLRLKRSATHLKITGADGFREVVPLDVILSDERLMLAYDWDGVPLLPGHGFPLRIYIPDVYGMKQPKWIESIEAIDHWEAGYWVVRGWDKEARMKATSVIDAISLETAWTNADGQTLVPIGGIAHAGARGISKVEVKIDDEPWRPAQLRTPLSPLTWVIWRHELPFQEGEHTLTVRCYDGNGIQQTADETPPDPSGATGLFSRSRLFR